MTKIISIFILLITVVSCAFLIRPKVVFEIENNTSKDLNLKVFGKSTLLNNIDIKSQTTFDTTVTYASPGSNNQNSPFDNEKVDSIVAVFSDKKLIKYYCDGERLIGALGMKLCSYNKIPMFFDFKSSKKLKPETTMVFAFEEEDYLNAKPL